MICLSMDVFSYCYFVPSFIFLIGSDIFCGGIRSDGWSYHPDTIKGSFTKTCPHYIGIVRLSSNLDASK